jgi:putative N6-adenine-specific DNA methylase
MEQTHTLIATTAMGLEAVLAREIKKLGYTDYKVFDGKVEFQGTFTDICKSNLWLRTAGKIYIKLASFEALTFDELFEKTKDVPWGDWIGPEDHFPVSKVTSRKSELFSKSDCQSIVKKAIVEQLRTAHNVTHLPETGSTFSVRIQIENDQVILSIDSSGEGLNKRGYRAHNDQASIRETLAAGLIYLSRWDPKNDVLIDPMCGSGTLLIEAGLMAKNIAPGLHRSFVSETWNCFPEKVWFEERSKASEAVDENAKFRIFGSDENGEALSIARENMEIAELSNIYVQKLSLKDLQSRFETGKIITNPPYGERLQEKEEVEDLYSTMGDHLRNKFKNWSYYILTSHKEFERHFGKKATKRRKLYNGGLECCYYQYFN